MRPYSVEIFFFVVFGIIVPAMIYSLHLFKIRARRSDAVGDFRVKIIKILYLMSCDILPKMESGEWFGDPRYYLNYYDEMANFDDMFYSKKPLEFEYWMREDIVNDIRKSGYDKYSLDELVTISENSKK